MRVVGLILLFLAASLALVGGYFLWTARDAEKPIASRVSSTDRGSDLFISTRPYSGSVDSPNKNTSSSSSTSTSMPSPPTPAPAEMQQDAAAKRAAEAATVADATRIAAEKAAQQKSLGGDVGDLVGELTPIVDPNRELGKIEENRKAREQLPKGNIVLNGPTAMKVTETRTVYANVGVNVPMETLRKYVRPDSQTAEGVLAVSSEMIAVLSGSGFKITSRTPEQQSVAERFPTVWSWDVEAKESGDQELEATLYALIGDKSSRQRIDSYTHKISVSVRPQTWGEWLKSFRDEIDTIKGIIVTVSGAVTGVAGWLVLYVDRRRRKGPAPAASEAS
jgi:hypothetical protein